MASFIEFYLAHTGAWLKLLTVRDSRAGDGNEKGRQSLAVALPPIRPSALQKDRGVSSN